MFSWTSSVEVTYKRPIGEYKRIAAVDKQTHQIKYIYKNAVEAARSILRAEYFNIEPSNELVQEVAKEIGKALNKYHKEVLGYWWKRIE